tara:strand:+ start:1226 stop:1459 length:234 start_codon:yes stop_codon:yes gene_type:complete
MNPFILIPWSLLTHTYDTIKAEKQQRTPMIYLDLLTELQNLSEEDLLKPVKIYDEDCEELLDTYSFDTQSDEPYLII